MAFYGTIEQVLTGWIFGLLPHADGTYERAKRFVVETICDGLEAQSARVIALDCGRHDRQRNRQAPHVGRAASRASARSPR